jgi:hypothetical protein
LLDLPATRSSVRAADACVQLFDGIPDGSVALPGSDWNVADVAAHLAVGVEHCVGYARGETDPFVDVSDIAGGSLARTSAQRLADEPDRLTGYLVAS